MKPPIQIDYRLNDTCRNPILEEWEDDSLTPKMGFENLFGLLKFQSSIVGVKTPCIKAFFILLESYRSVNVENGFAWAIWRYAAQVMTKRKVGNRPDLGACRGSATHCWKTLDEGYNFASNLIAIGGLHKKLCALKVAGVLIVGISGLPLGSPGTKNHLDVAPVKSCRVYYMGKGGGFPWVRAVMSLVSPKLPVTRPSIKGAPESELTNLWLVGCRIKWVIEKLVTLPSPIPKPQHAPSTLSSAESWERALNFEQFRYLTHLYSSWV
jgi:hypothetical protein